MPAITFEQILKFNPNHDNLGRFSSSNGGGRAAGGTLGQFRGTVGGADDAKLIGMWESYREDTSTAGMAMNSVIESELEDRGLIKLNDDTFEYELTDKAPKKPQKGQAAPTNKDSTGKELTPQQAEYFKDSKARDENGNLYVVYHNTNVSGINEFRTQTPSGYGGLYTTTEESVAQGFRGEQTYKLYANLKNPLIVDAGNKAYNNIDPPDGMGSSYTFGAKTVDTQGIAAYARDSGYDGLIVQNVREPSGYGTDVIAFHPDQLKAVDNGTPTASRNIHKAEEPSKMGNSNFTIYKADDDKRLVFGWASVAITVDGSELEDRQHDMIEPEDLEDAAYEYVLNFRDTGEEHLPGYRKKGKLVESVVLTKEKQKAMGIPEGILPVAWWIGFKIEDDETWRRVKNGTYKMFSIEGKAQRIPVEKARRNYDEFPSYSMWLEENLDATIDEQKAAKAWYKVNKSQPTGCGVLVIQDGKILTGTRKDHHGICGPGGHIEAGETPEQAARREAAEEFGILCNDLKPLGIQDGGKNGTSAVFLCTNFSGTPRTDEDEMTAPTWRSRGEIETADTFPPFAQSLQLLPKERVAKTFEEIIEKFNPYHDSLGRFSTSTGYASFTTHTKDPNKQHMADMAVARLKQQSAAQAAAQAAAKPPKPATPPKPKVNYDSKGFADHDDADYHQLYNRKKYFQQQQLTAAQKKAADSYVDPNTEPGSLYNVAQNMNYAMVSGQKLSPKHQQVHDDMMSAMHNVGYNVNLTRYDHDGMINSLLQSTGAGTDYTRMSQSQLQKALVGQSFGENKFVSASTNDFANASPNVQRLFRDRAVKVNYKVPANAKALLMPIGAGGDQGEMVMAPTTGKSGANATPKITGVRYTGKTVYRMKTGRSYPQIEIDVSWD